MTVPSSAEILTLETDAVPAFIQAHASAKTLSTLVQRLNLELAGGDQSARDMAARALEHLGFVEIA